MPKPGRGKLGPKWTRVAEGFFVGGGCRIDLLLRYSDEASPRQKGLCSMSSLLRGCAPT